MKDKLKWAYTFTLLLITMSWAVFLCYLVLNAHVAGITEVDIISVAGVGVLLGSLITWCGNVNQYWFRKKSPDNKPPVE